jgi:electron transfer flavoprotein beta subunit
MSVHIIVCIKSVVNAAPRGAPRRTPENSELNPFDRPALEAALQVAASAGGTVTALSMGPDVAAESLAEARAMGVNAAVLINDRSLAESDTLVTSRVLAAAVRRIGAFDLLFFGTRTSDSDTSQVGPQTAAVLDVPFVGGVKGIERGDGGWRIRRSVDGWEETWRVRSPAAAAIDPGAFGPRPVGLVGIAHAFEQPAITRWSLDDVDLAPSQVGLAGSPTRVAALQSVKHDRHCRMLAGEPADQIDQLMKQLIHSGLIG